MKISLGDLMQYGISESENEREWKRGRGGRGEASMCFFQL